MDFLKEHWFQLLQTIGIIASILFTATQIRFQRKSQKVSNSLLVTQHHRDIWKAFISDEKFSRLFQNHIDLVSSPVTEPERMFMNLVFLHISAVLKAIRAKAIFPIEGLESDVGDMLSYPIPREVWREVADYQDVQLREFVNWAASKPSSREVPQTLVHALHEELRLSEK
jgi:hypothetical protein